MILRYNDPNLNVINDTVTSIATSISEIDGLLANTPDWEDKFDRYLIDLDSSRSNITLISDLMDVADLSTPEAMIFCNNIRTGIANQYKMISWFPPSNTSKDIDEWLDEVNVLYYRILGMGMRKKLVERGQSLDIVAIFNLSKLDSEIHLLFKEYLILEYRNRLYLNCLRKIDFYSTGRAVVKMENLPKKKSVIRESLEKFDHYGIWDLPMLKNIGDKRVIGHLEREEFPYIIAFLNHVGFVDHFKSFFRSQGEFYKEFSTILDLDERGARGLINVLNPNSKENRKKYTAHLHKKDVEVNYNNLNIS